MQDGRERGRDEMNLSEFPLTLLTTRAPEDVKTIVYEDEIRDKGTGQLTRRTLTITGSDAWGLPTAHDDDVLIALLQLTWRQNGFTDATVRFTRYELLKVLRWPDEGRNFKRIEESIRRWVGVTLHYKGSWWDKEKKTWKSHSFHIIEQATILDRKEREQAEGLDTLCSITWNVVFFASLAAGYIKQLDIGLYFRLRLAISRRLYRYLDKHHYNDRYKFDLRVLAHDKLGLSKNYDIGQVKRQLRKALNELVEAGFLEKMEESDRYKKDGRGVWTVTLRPCSNKGNLPALEASGFGVERYWDGLTLVEQSKLEHEAMQSATEEQLETLSTCTHKKLRGAIIKSIRDSHIQKLLENSHG